jgi:hypothetical protein
MELVVLTKTIIKKLVSKEDSISVKDFESNEDNTIQIEVLVSKEDLGKVIGKNGRTINSIRTIVQASARINGNKRVRINVDSY